MSAGENLPVGPAASERAPLGMMVPAVPAGVEIPPEPPDVAARALSVASRLLCGATTFFFMAFVFAYFYLRSLDQSHMWRPAHIDVDQGLGAAFIATLVVSALLAIFAGRRLKAGSSAWFAPAAGALLLGLAAVALQCIEYTKQSFGPTGGGFASVFCAWTVFYLIAVLATMYWIETNLASARRAGVRSARGEQPASGDIKEPARLIAPGFDAAVFYWGFLAALGVVMYVILYLL
jgi:heme/copper-type cytochrome/quinol oxidase subunit 3